MIDNIVASLDIGICETRRANYLGPRSVIESNIHYHPGIIPRRLHCVGDLRLYIVIEAINVADGLKAVAMRNQGKYAGLPTSMTLDEALFGEMIRTRSIA